MNEIYTARYVCSARRLTEGGGGEVGKGIEGAEGG